MWPAFSVLFIRYYKVSSDFNYLYSTKNCRHLNKIHPVVLKVLKRQTTFWKWQDRGIL